MSPKKLIVLFSLPLILSAFVFPQSVVELTKVEKERRERLKNKKIVLVTNANLKNLKKRASLTVTSPEAPFEDIQPETTSTMEDLPPDSPGRKPVTDQMELEKSILLLEERWNSVQEYISLLTTKMNALWQEFYSMDDMTSKDSIQQQIAETAQKLENAQAEEVKIREELESLRAQVKK